MQHTSVTRLRERGWAAAGGAGGGCNRTEGLNKAQISKGTAALRNKVDRRRDDRDRPPLQKPKEQEGRLAEAKAACLPCLPCLPSETWVMEEGRKEGRKGT